MAMSHTLAATGTSQLRLSQPACRGLPALPRRSIARAEASSTQGAKVAAVSAASSLLLAQHALAAQEVGQLAASDNRLLILATVFLPAVGWVAFNIAGPALNQVANISAKREQGKEAFSKGGLRGTKSTKSTKKRAVLGPLAGLTAASLMLSAQQADAAQEVLGHLAADTRLGVLAALFLPAIGWVAFNIGGPALNQVANISAKREQGKEAFSKGGLRKRR